MAKSSKSRPTSKTRRPAPLEGNTVWRGRSRVRKAGPSLQEATFWEGLPWLAQHAICLGFLLIVAAGFFGSTLFGGKTLAGTDTVQWRATAEALIDYEAQTGKPALWAPNVFGGMPAYLIRYPTSVPGADSLLTWLRGLGLWPFAHFYALLVGTYLLSVFLTRSKLAGVIAAVGFGLSTYLPIILTAGHNTKFVALAYAPWLLLGFAGLVRRPAETSKMMSALLMLLFAIAASVNLRAGHIQITYYVVVLAAVWWVAEGIAAARSKTLPTFLASTGLLAVGSAIALAMVAHPYLSQWEYKAFTTRASGPGGGLAWEAAMAWSQGLGELLTLLVPNAYGGGGQFYWGPKVFTVGPHYVGPVVLLLALVGAVGVARRSVAAFATATVLFVLFALGQNLPIVNRPAFELLPLFNAFRVPETWLSIVALLLALLAGWGAYYVGRREATHEAEGRKRRVVIGAFVVLLVVVGGLWATGGGPLAFERPDEPQQIMAAAAQQTGLSPGDPQVRQMAGQYLDGVRAERADLLSADAGRSLLFLLLAGALVGLVLWRRAPAWAMLAGLALLTTIDLWGVGRRYYNDDTGSMRTRAAVEASIPETDADRFIAQQVDAAGGFGHFRVMPANPLSNAVSSYRAESVGGYNAARMTLIQDYFDRLLPDSTTGYNRNALRLLSVRYLVAGGAVPGFTPVYQDPQTGQVVLEDSTALPRAFFVDSVAVEVDAAAVRDRLRRDDFDPSRTALVSAPLEGGFTAAQLTGPPPDSLGATVTLERFSPNEIVYKVRTDRPRLLVASELYYPAGWSATVGADPVPIVQTDVLLRGIPVPAGEHLVSMDFRPESHRRGLFISWIATLLTYIGAIALGGMLWFRRGRS